jgi:hypothetical protein
MLNRKTVITIMILASLFAVSAVSAQNDTDTHYGFCVLAEDMDKVDFKNLSDHGVTDLFLDYRCMDTHDKAQVEKWIADAKSEGISVHMLAQIFNDDEKWYNPTNQSFVDAKIKELEDYASLKDLAGIHMNYIRYEGAKSAENDEYAQAISDFVVNSTEAIRKVNPNLILSSDVMPEYDQLKEKYCTDYDVISKNFDFVVPLTYFENNNENDTFIVETIECLADHSKGAKVWANVQTFDNATQTPIGLKEMNAKIQNISKANPDGIFFFRYGMTEDIDFNNLK